MNRLFLWFFVLALHCFFLQNSNATDFGSLSVNGSSGASAVVNRGKVTSIIQKLPAGSGATILGEFQMLIKKRPYVVTGARTIGGGAIISGALKLAKLMGPLGLAFTLSDLIWNPLKGIWEKQDQDTSDYPPGEYWTCNRDMFRGPSPESVCRACIEYYGKIYGRVQGPVNGPWGCQTCSTSDCFSYGNYSPIYKLQSCPEGYIYDSQSAMCLQLSMVPATDTDLINAITPQVNTSPANAANQATKNKENDESDFVNSLGPLDSVSGPSQTSPDTTVSQSGLSHQIADTDGDGIPETQTDTTTTTTTTYYTITYNTDNSVSLTEHKTTETQVQTSVTYSTTNQTTVTNTTNTTQTTTDNTSDPITGPPENPDSTTDSPTASDWPSFCSWASVVCDFIDWVKQEPSIPDDPLLPTEELDSSMQSWSLNLGLGSCPSDVNVSLPQGQSMVFSYSIPCNILSTYIYPIVLLMSAILSAYILAGVKVD